MRLYFAGNVKGNDVDTTDYATGVRNRLLSFAFLDSWAVDAFAFWVDRRPPEASVFLDSGAFSAYTQGTVIDLGQYCAYIEEHRPALAAYAVLDVIGSAEQSRRNLETMQKRGLDPVPVFHVGNEGLDVLEGILNDRAGYVALGGMASDRPPRAVLQRKLDACWSVIVRGWPVKVHALGVMAQWALERYPWYSADACSAIVASVMGRVSRFEDGRHRSIGWRDDLERRGDGVVADGVGRRVGAKSDSAHGGRRRRNIEAQLALERHVTKLWHVRGVTWDNSQGKITTTGETVQLVD